MYAVVTTLVSEPQKCRGGLYAIWRGLEGVCAQFGGVWRAIKGLTSRSALVKKHKETASADPAKTAKLMVPAAVNVAPRGSAVPTPGWPCSPGRDT
eukprot:2572243-Pyramimonas_sp.AAC.2